MEETHLRHQAISSSALKSNKSAKNIMKNPFDKTSDGKFKKVKCYIKEVIVILLKET